MTTEHDFDINYDEAQICDYTLPDPLIFEDGTQVTSPEQWEVRRKELLSLFETHVYGRAPGKPDNMTFAVTSVDENALDGRALRKEVTIFINGQGNVLKIDVLIYLPKESSGAVPTFLGLNFSGNHTIHTDPCIKLTERWIEGRVPGIVNNRATEESRGANAHRWAVERILARGYALATIYAGDIALDRQNSFKEGVHALYFVDGQTKPAPDEWGTLAAWSWGLCRALDYLETSDDHGAVMAMGHSRMGKAAVWAAAQDESFALAISNNSGCGGAALSRRNFGETVEAINVRFPHWFCGNFHQYNTDIDALPVDQHMLLALLAPRPVYVASAEDDLWADPHGEFLSCVHANPVYRLLGKHGLTKIVMPPVHYPIMGDIGYHMRAGGHDVTAYDWERYMDFADRRLP